MARTVALPLLLLGLAAVASGALAAPAPERAARAVVVPAGYRQHAVREAGISVALPIGWQVVAQRDAVFPGVAQTLARLDRSFRAPLTALAWPDSPLKLFAFDRVFWHHRPTTAMVAQVTYGRPGSFARWSARVRAELARAPGIRGGVHVAGVGPRPSTRLRAVYHTSTGDTVVDYFLAGRDGVWVLMFRTPTAHAAAAAAAFDRAAGTFVLSSPLGGPISSGPQLPA